MDFADKNPDKWAGAVDVFGRLSGYKDEMEITHNVYAAVKVMGDMDLENTLRTINNQIGDSTLTDPDQLLLPTDTMLPYDPKRESNHQNRKSNPDASPNLQQASDGKKTKIKKSKPKNTVTIHKSRKGRTFPKAVQRSL